MIFYSSEKKIKKPFIYLMNNEFDQLCPSRYNRIQFYSFFFFLQNRTLIKLFQTSALRKIIKSKKGEKKKEKEKAEFSILVT